MNVSELMNVYKSACFKQNLLIFLCTFYSLQIDLSLAKGTRSSTDASQFLANQKYFFNSQAVKMHKFL
jgi:hypothetical protein